MRCGRTAVVATVLATLQYATRLTYAESCHLCCYHKRGIARMPMLQAALEMQICILFAGVHSPPRHFEPDCDAQHSYKAVISSNVI